MINEKDLTNELARRLLQKVLPTEEIEKAFAQNEKNP